MTNPGTWQNPQGNRGAPPPGAGGVVTGPHLYAVNTAAAVPWAAGRLGYEPAAFCGVFDLRPWEGPPAETAAGDWFRSVQPVDGGAAILRVQRIRTGLNGPFDLPTARGLRFDGLELIGSLSVMVAGFEAPAGSYVLQQGRSRNPYPPRADVDPWDLPTIAEMGPNLIPELTTTGVSEFNASEWARGSRFVAIWLLGFWAGQALSSGYLVQWSVTTQQTAPAWGSPTITWPAIEIADGPYAGPTEAGRLWAFGSFPNRGAPTLRRWSIFNGGANPVTITLRELVGPNPNLAAYTGADDVIAVPAGQTVVSVAAPRQGYSLTGVWGGHTLAQGATGGPVLISCAGGG